jgi:sugar O-acyltransferase (sialic acid O-acetyltransferase NeuD family)
MGKTLVVIYAAGGFGREVAWLVESCSDASEEYVVACFADDNASVHSLKLNDVPVMGLEEAYRRFPNAVMIGAVGSPEIRQQVMEKSASVGFSFGTFIHPRVERSRWLDVGIGTVICAGSILTTNINLGKHVQINLDCTIGHDVVMGDYTTLAPGVHVSGWVHFGQRVYVGTGAVIINGTKENPISIGDDAVIGAGACVARSVPEGVTVVGVPARPLRRTMV